MSYWIESIGLKYPRYSIYTLFTGAARRVQIDMALPSEIQNIHVTISTDKR